VLPTIQNYMNNLSIDELHKDREDFDERTKHMTEAEIINLTHAEALPIIKRLETIRSERRNSNGLRKLV